MATLPIPDKDSLNAKSRPPELPEVITAPIRWTSKGPVRSQIRGDRRKRVADQRPLGFKGKGKD